MKTTFMNVSRRVIGALAVLLGISSCQSSQSEMTFEQEGDSLTVIHITNPTRYLLCPSKNRLPKRRFALRQIRFR
jgi:fructan beta-fructosidase